jgi:hypothetical protein
MNRFANTDKEVGERAHHKQEWGGLNEIGCEREENGFVGAVNR